MDAPEWTTLPVNRARRRSRGAHSAWDKWKQHEREWAAWSGGERVASQGVACEDLRSLPEEQQLTWTAEHKTTKAVPVWYSKQIQQARGNAERKPGHLPLMYTTIAPGQGVKTTRIMAIEVDFATTEFADALYELLSAARDFVDEGVA